MFRKRRVAFSTPLFVSLVITGLILLPVIFLVYDSFFSVGLGKQTGFTIKNYVDAYADPQFWPTLINSVMFGAGAATMATFLGTMVAWIVVRTNAPHRGLIEVLPLFALFVPAITDDVAWIYLLAPRSGILNNLLSDLLGYQVAIFNAFSLPAMIWVKGLAWTTLAYLLTMPIFSTMDASLEEAARVSGANTRSTLIRVTFPLAVPSIMSVFILVFLQALRIFETPALLGIPGGIYVFTTRIYDAMDISFRPGLATAYSTTLIVISVMVVGVYVWTVRKADKYAVIIGKGYRPKPLDIGLWKYAALAFFVVYFFLAVVMPYSTVLMVSFIPFYNYDMVAHLFQKASLESYWRVLNHPSFINGMRNALQVGLMTVGLTVTSATIVAHMIHRGTAKARKVFEFFGTLPLALPGIVLALGLILAFIRTPVYGTILVIAITFVIYYYPMAIRNASSATLSIHKELEESARTHGAKWLQAFRMVDLPLLKPAVMASLFYIFIETQKQVGAAVMLTGPGVEYGPVTLFEYFRVGQWTETAAGSIILSMYLLAVVLVAKYVFKVKFRL